MQQQNVCVQSKVAHFLKCHEHHRVVRIDVYMMGDHLIHIGEFSYECLYHGESLHQCVKGGLRHKLCNRISVAAFRGFDTLGEISVLAIAAVGIYGLLNGLRLPHPVRDYGGRLWSTDRHPMVLDTLSRVLLPMALIMTTMATSNRCAGETCGTL